MNQIAIPEGFRFDAQRRLVHEDMIKPIDKTRDALVVDLVQQGLAVQDTLQRFKAAAFGDIEAFIDLSAEQYQVKLGGKKGNVTLMSFDGRYKIVRSIQESIAFDERLQAARALIDECLQEWTEGARPEVVTLVNDAFRTDTKGERRPVAGLISRDVAEHAGAAAAVNAVATGLPFGQAHVIGATR